MRDNNDAVKKEEDNTMTNNKPTNAAELAALIQAKKDEAAKSTKKAVDDFLEEWGKYPTAVKRITKEELVNLFGREFWYATEELKKRGFDVDCHAEKVTGHLWWRKVTPEMWEIKIPDLVLHPMKL